MADTRLYELEECVSPQADDILLIEESATQTDKKVKVSSLMPTDAVESAVADWLTAHPEATTTVEDGSITPVKLATSTMDLFDAKANTAGEYDDMTVGSAKQLLSKGYTENKTPYIYRASAGGDRVYEELIGGTVAWNQLLNNTSTITTNANETTSTQVESISITDGHKYIFMTTQDVAVSTYTRNSMVLIVGGNSYYSNPMIQGVNGWVFSASESNNSSSFRIWIASPNVTVKHNNFMAIDLTQMFGSIIADYIYSLEQSTAGAGVAYFRQMFPNDYYAYDSGSLQSVNVASKKVVGFNQIDESQIVNGSIDTHTGAVQTNANRNITGFIKINPNWTYYMKHVPQINIGIYAFFYNENQSYIGYHGNSLRNSQFTPKDLANNLSDGGSFEDARYVRFRIDLASYSVGDVCLNISNPSKNGTYEPYEEHTYAFDSDLTLRGIPKLDANNNLYYDGDVYESDGSVTRKYGVVDLGSLNWVKFLDRVGVFASTSDVDNMYVSGSNAVEVPIKCGKYVSGLSANELLDDDNLNNSIAANGVYPRFIVRDTSKNSLNPTEFAAAMVGVYVLYPLATQTSENADPFINPQIVDADGTEEFVDYMQSQSTRDVAVPVGHESKYMINLRQKIENAVMLPTLPTANGTYTLKCTVASRVPTLSWVAD